MPCKRIVLLNVSNTLNMGSMMMAEALMHHLAAWSETPLEFIIPTPTPEETLSRLRAALGTHTPQVVLSTIDGDGLWRGSRWQKLLAATTGLGTATVLADGVAECDLVVVLGGDDFTEDYQRNFAVTQLLQLRILAQRRIPVVMCGQTMGPFSSWRRWAVPALARTMAAILARDCTTYRYLTEELKLRKNVHLTADLAFLPLACEDASAGERFHLASHYVTLVPSELIWRYAHEADRTMYITALAEVATYILEQMPEVHLVLLPHVLHPESSDDRLAVQSVSEQLQGYGNRIVTVTETLLPYEARAILGGSKFVLTGRMHAAVSALTQGVLPLSMAYSRKYWGVLGEDLGLGNWIVDVRQGSWQEITEQLKQCIDALGEQHDEVLACVEQACIRSRVNVETVAGYLQ